MKHLKTFATLLLMSILTLNLASCKGGEEDLHELVGTTWQYNQDPTFVKAEFATKEIVKLTLIIGGIKMFDSKEFKYKYTPENKRFVILPESANVNGEIKGDVMTVNVHGQKYQLNKVVKK